MAITMSLKTQRFCEYCNSDHALRYLIAKGDQHKHLVYDCPKRGVRFVALVEGLDIPTTYSAQYYHDKNKARQQKLL